MVKVGILNAEKPLAGEVIRILINHPETELTRFVAPAYNGRSIASVHHGLIGEDSFNFTAEVPTDEIDFLIALNPDPYVISILEQVKDDEDKKLVSLFLPSEGDNEDNYEIGLSEINRKNLVRGARKAYVASPSVVASLVALSPLADFMLLNDDINIKVSLPKDIVESLNIEEDRNLLEKIIKYRQPSFSSRINLEVMSNKDSERESSSRITFKSSLPIEEFEKIYDGVYDDHNFTFMTHGELNLKEVEGTQKIIMRLEKPDPENLEIDIINDARMRGGAGDIVHVLNLFFGLHEKTGLSLKPSRF